MMEGEHGEKQKRKKKTKRKRRAKENGSDPVRRPLFAKS